MTRAAGLTQAERSERTRERLFLATIHVATGSGFEALSTRRVAAAAGMTMGAIYAHFDGRESLIVAALQWYRAHTPDFDIPDASDVRELARGRVLATMAMADAPDEATRTVVRFQQELGRLEETDPAIRDLVEQWNEARIASFRDRVEEVAKISGERLLVTAQRLAEQVVALSGALATCNAEAPGLLPEPVAIAAVDALVDAVVAPSKSSRDKARGA